MSLGTPGRGDKEGIGLGPAQQVGYDRYPSDVLYCLIPRLAGLPSRKAPSHILRGVAGQQPPPQDDNKRDGGLFS